MRGLFEELDGQGVEFQSIQDTIIVTLPAARITEAKETFLKAGVPDDCISVEGNTIHVLSTLRSRGGIMGVLGPNPSNIIVESKYE